MGRRRRRRGGRGLWGGGGGVSVGGWVGGGGTGEGGPGRGGMGDGGEVRSASKLSWPLWRAARARGSVMVGLNWGLWGVDRFVGLI